MKKHIARALAGTALSFSVEAGDPSLPRPGEYEVQIRLELPHIEDMGVTKTAKICVTETGTHGLVVLSDNNPLSRCPASNIRRDGDTLTFELVCPGQNQAVARAKFTMRGESFTGAFDMKMGGKNMTMTERQSGRRIGDCRPSGASPS